MPLDCIVYTLGRTHLCLRLPSSLSSIPILRLPLLQVTVTSSLWDLSDASGHSGELGLLAAIWFLVFFWLVLFSGYLVLAYLDLVLPLAIDLDNLKSLD